MQPRHRGSNSLRQVGGECCSHWSTGSPCARRRAGVAAAASSLRDLPGPKSKTAPRRGRPLEQDQHRTVGGGVGMTWCHFPEGERWRVGRVGGHPMCRKRAARQTPPGRILPAAAHSGRGDLVPGRGAVGRAQLVGRATCQAGWVLRGWTYRLAASRHGLQVVRGQADRLPRTLPLGTTLSHPAGIPSLLLDTTRPTQQATPLRTATP